MIQRIRGNGIPSWPEGLRRAALPHLPDTHTPFNPTISAPARVWRAGKLSDSRSGISRDRGDPPAGIGRG